MANTFPALWVRKHFSKGNRPVVKWIEASNAQTPEDINTQGNMIWWPDAVVLPDGEIVSRWRYFGTLQFFNAIVQFTSKTPVLWYSSWETPGISLSLDEYRYSFSHNPVLPLQPEIGYSEAEIEDYWNHRL